MKFKREIKVALVFIAAIFLLYFGMNFLKGIDIFSTSKKYYGRFDQLNSLAASSPVYIKGYKVGQVSRIDYDFTVEHPFLVEVTIESDIKLVEGSQIALVSDGLLGGAAIEMKLSPYSEELALYNSKDTLPTIVERGLIEELQNGVIADLNRTINDLDSIVVNLKGQMEGDHLKNILANADQVSADLNTTSTKLKRIVTNDVPPIVADAKSTIIEAKSAMANLNNISQKVDSVDIKGIVAKVDTTMSNVQDITTSLNSKEGTVGLLLNDKTLYNKINNTVVSVDSLINDVKANPKKYLKISVF